MSVVPRHFAMAAMACQRFIEQKQGIITTRPIKGAINRCGNEKLALIFDLPCELQFFSFLLEMIGTSFDIHTYIHIYTHNIYKIC